MEMTGSTHICLVCVLEDVVGINLTVYTEKHKQSRGATDQLNVFIFLTALLALNAEALLNNVLLMYRAPQVLELLRMFSFIERLIGVPQYVQCESVKFARKLVASQVALTFLNVSMNIYSDFGTAVFVQDSRELAPVNMVIAVSNAFTGVPFLTVNCVSTRLLLMYISRLIGLYVRCILKNVDQCLRSWSTTDSSKVIQMVQTRYQISLLKSCSNLASSFLGPSMLYGYSYSVVLLCTAAYYTIIPDLQFRARLFFLTLGILHWLSILLPVCEVNRMKSTYVLLSVVMSGHLEQIRVHKENTQEESRTTLRALTIYTLVLFGKHVTKLLDAVQRITVANYSEEMSAQLRMLVESLKPADLKYSACGFFEIDLSTSTQILGAVITYTVLLVQTNQNYVVERCTNTTVI